MLAPVSRASGLGETFNPDHAPTELLVPPISLFWPTTVITQNSGYPINFNTIWFLLSSKALPTGLNSTVTTVQRCFQNGLGELQHWLTT